MTNREFCKKDQVFQLSCAIAKTKPTKRQASKFRMGKGSARPWAKSAEAMLKMNNFNSCMAAVETGGAA